MLQGGYLLAARCTPCSSSQENLDGCCLRARLRLVSDSDCVSTARRPRWRWRTCQDWRACIRTAYRRAASGGYASASVTRYVFAPPQRPSGAPLSNFSSPRLRPCAFFQVLGALRLFLVALLRSGLGLE